MVVEDQGRREGKRRPIQSMNRGTKFYKKYGMDYDEVFAPEVTCKQVREACERESDVSQRKTGGNNLYATT